MIKKAWSMTKRLEWLYALKTMLRSEYWTKANTIEFLAFVVKAAIIIPGLVFDIQVWWLYVLALLTSFMIIWSSTVKTLPTLIWFNILWIFLAIIGIVKNI
jgi:hypothetical protein